MTDSSGNEDENSAHFFLLNTAYGFADGWNLFNLYTSNKKETLYIGIANADDTKRSTILVAIVMYNIMPFSKLNQTIKAMFDFRYLSFIEIKSNPGLYTTLFFMKSPGGLINKVRAMPMCLCQ